MLTAHRQLTIDADVQRLRALGYDPTHLTNPYARSAYAEYHAQAIAGEFDYLPLFLKPEAISIDVGANNGRYTIKLAAGTRHCLAIEPVHTLHGLGDGLPSNCTFRNVAAGAHAAQGVLKIPRFADGTVWDGGSTLGSTIALGIQTFTEQATDIRSVDDLVAELFPDQPIGFIKIDVEGTERDVVAGCTAILRRWRPNLQVEIWKEEVVETAQLLHDHGYTGVFFFEGNIQAISCFNPSIHCADEHAWRPGKSYNLRRYVDNFFFIPK
jgi:FkbM family methyltransferase